MGRTWFVGVPCRWGMGFSLELAMFPGTPPGARAAWWAGNGGSLSFVDLVARLAIGYVPNRWITGPFEQSSDDELIGSHLLPPAIDAFLRDCASNA